MCQRNEGKKNLEQDMWKVKSQGSQKHPPKILIDAGVILWHPCTIHDLCIQIRNYSYNRISFVLESLFYFPPELWFFSRGVKGNSETLFYSPKPRGPTMKMESLKSSLNSHQTSSQSPLKIVQHWTYDLNLTHVKHSSTLWDIITLHLSS